MPSLFPLLEKNRHDAIAVAHPAACIMVQCDTAFADSFGGNTVLLCPVADFLIATFTVDKIDIYGAFISENGGRSGITTMAICFAHE